VLLALKVNDAYVTQVTYVFAVDDAL